MLVVCSDRKIERVVKENWEKANVAQTNWSVLATKGLYNRSLLTYTLILGGM